MRPRVGVSACLLGESVRHDGRHKRSEPVLELAKAFELVPICPEVEIGLGVPREPIQLERREGVTKLLGVTSRRDHTEAMTSFAARKLSELSGLSGYVLKSRSPSCGLVDTPLIGTDEKGSGLFAAALRAAYPSLPIVDERSLEDPEACARFVALVRAYPTGV
ncbi:MAG TPA: DUF523 domain-containing protein [Planctomycetota bacterium]|nr:DUF523 domain-containing protein [Planctomycetota bacterium]